jgi:LCP family protein required for cell wall assembly
LGAVLLTGGMVGGLSALDLFWPRPDKAYQAPREITPANLALKPSRPVTVLVVGLDTDRLGAPRNGAAPAGPANADALLLVRVQPDGPLQVVNLPIELAVQLPGIHHPQALASLYRTGGVALVADAVRELTGLQPPSPDRYLVLSRSALRNLINGVGGLEIDPPRAIHYADRSQKLKIDLEAGLQRLGGLGVEQLLRFRDRQRGDGDRRLTHERVEVALRDRMRQTEPLSALPLVIRDLQGKVETNLSPEEALSLLAAGLDDRRSIAFRSLPLDPPRPGQAGLRQLNASSPAAIWSQAGL